METYELIGMTITDIRYKLKLKAIDDWLDSFETYITLNSKITITFPLTEKVEKIQFGGITKRFSRKIEKILIGFKIIDILFSYFENKIEDSPKLFIQLSNKLYITETIVAPHGTGGAGLFIYDSEEFKSLLNDMKSDNCNLNRLPEMN